MQLRTILHEVTGLKDAPHNKIRGNSEVTTPVIKNLGPIIITIVTDGKDEQSAFILIIKLTSLLKSGFSIPFSPGCIGLWVGLVSPFCCPFCFSLRRSFLSLQGKERVFTTINTRHKQYHTA